MRTYVNCCFIRYLNAIGAKTKNQPRFTVSVKNAFSRTFCISYGRRHGNYLVGLYLFTKVLFIINVTCQLFALNSFLGMNYNMYGFDVVGELLRGDDWTESDRFPRVTMCDLKVRRLGNVQRYTVQCVLPINLFNEKIYLFLWFWMVFVATMACVSLLTWTMRSVFNSDRMRYVKKHIVLMQEQSGGDDLDIKSTDGRRHFRSFVQEYLQQDGVFVLRLVGHNTNAITVTEFVWDLWKKYCHQPRDNNDTSSVTST